ncbi:hypothetical protein PC39_11707 [Salinisphaera sp. PC39]|uniref:DUF2057 family protein n=1 Tax=Salinisphaera sp. PC39 TaxID=1304156 RepID=UPI00333E5E95
MPFRPLAAALLAGTLFGTAGCAARIDHELATAGADSAQVILPAHIVAVSVDDRTLNESTYVFDSRETRLALPPGEHRLRLRYMDMLPENDGRQADDVKVYSEPVALEATLAAGTDYRVAAERPATLAEARRFAAVPVIELTAADGRVLAAAEAPPPRPAAPTARGGGTAPGALEMLEFWWQRADAAERRRFLERHAAP